MLNMTIEDKEIPRRWIEILTQVQEHCPEAILAGGCLRDLVLGGEVKDLDIFVSVTGNGALDLQWRLQADLLWRGVMHCGGGYGQMRAEVANVDGFRTPDGLEVQIIYLHDFEPLKALSQFDFAACQIGTTGRTWRATEACLKDLRERRITLLPPVDYDQACRSLLRGERFTAKYAGTDVVVDTSAATPVITREETHTRCYTWTELQEALSI